jgi:Flp pilus assembly CpaE family ATPase
MPTILVTSARGGAGASLLAANLGVALAEVTSCWLLDLHGVEAVDDLLLDLEPVHGWTDLIATPGLPSEEHLARASCLHPSGLRLLAGGTALEGAPAPAAPLLQALAAHADWLIVDTSSACAVNGLLDQTDLVLLVVTTDPPSLRAAQRWLLLLPTTARRRIALVVNQVSPGQPLIAAGVGHALELPLWAWLPADATAIGRQVHFGAVAALAPGSPYGRAILQLARRLLTSRAQQVRVSPAGRAKIRVGEGTG